MSNNVQCSLVHYTRSSRNNSNLPSLHGPQAGCQGHLTIFRGHSGRCIKLRTIPPNPRVIFGTVRPPSWTQNVWLVLWLNKGTNFTFASRLFHRNAAIPKLRSSWKLVRMIGKACSTYGDSKNAYSIVARKPGTIWPFGTHSEQVILKWILR